MRTTTKLLVLVASIFPRLAAAQGAPATPSTAEPPATAAPATAAPPDPRLDDLDQRMRVVERRCAVEQEALAEKKTEESQNPPGVAVAYGKDGVAIKSADGKFQFRFRPVVQADARFFVKSGSDTFLLRRVRPVIEGTAFDFFDWRLMPELAGTPNVQDAYVNIRVVKEVQ